MDIKVVDHATMHDQIRKDVNPLVVYVAFRPTADTYLTQFFHSDSIVVTGKNPNTNFAHYDKIDAQIEPRATSPTPPNRKRSGSKPRLRPCRTWSPTRSSTPTRSTPARTNVDYGHALKSVIQLYPGIDETTRLTKYPEALMALRPGPATSRLLTLVLRYVAVGTGSGTVAHST